MTPGKALVAGAGLLLVSQSLRFPSEVPLRATLVFVFVPVFAMALFLVGLACACPHERAPWGITAAAAAGGCALAFFTTPGMFLTPELELFIFGLGAASLTSVSFWAAVRSRSRSGLAAALLVTAGTLSCLLLLRAGAVRYAAHYGSESTGVVGLYERTRELAVGFGLAGILHLTAVAVRARAKVATQ